MTFGIRQLSVLAQCWLFVHSSWLVWKITVFKGDVHIKSSFYILYDWQKYEIKLWASRKIRAQCMRTRAFLSSNRKIGCGLKWNGLQYSYIVRANNVPTKSHSEHHWESMWKFATVITRLTWESFVVTIIVRTIIVLMGSRKSSNVN